MNNHPSDELKLMILEYQTVFVHNINMRHGTAVSMHNPRHINMLNDIWDAAKVDQVDIPGAKKWKKIGFTVKYKHIIKKIFYTYMVITSLRYLNVNSVEQEYLV